MSAPEPGVEEVPTPDPLDVLKYVVALAEVVLEGCEGDHEQLLEDMDWLLSPFVVPGEPVVYSDGRPITSLLRELMSGRSKQRLHLPPGFPLDRQGGAR